MAFSKRQREILAELSELCNQLGVELDGTATNVRKYIDRQMALMDVHKIIYGVLCDDSENEFRDEDVADAYKSLETLREIKSKIYPDRNGYLKPGEKQ